MNKSLANITPDRALSLVLKAIEDNPKLQDTTKDKYSKALENYSAGGKRSVLDADSLAKYCKTASESTKSFLKAGIGKLIKAEKSRIASYADPYHPEVVKLNAMMEQRFRQLDEVGGAIEIETPKGEKVHTWLSPVELKDLIAKTRENGSTLIEIRDRVALGLMSNGMLRRSEAVSLLFSDVKEREGYSILEVKGKGAKTRGVKLSDSLAKDIDCLRELLGDGFILRAMLKRKVAPEGYTLIGDYYVGKSISSQALYDITAKYGKKIGKSLQPHDLRRTGSQIAWKAGVPIEQVSLALGHESIETTVLYLGIERDWDKQPSDFIPY